MTIQIMALNCFGFAVLKFSFKMSTLLNTIPYCKAQKQSVNDKMS